MKHYQYCVSKEMFNVFMRMRERAEIKVPDYPYKVGDILEAIEIGNNGQPTGQVLELYISRVVFGKLLLRKDSIKLGRRIEVKKLSTYYN